MDTDEIIKHIEEDLKKLINKEPVYPIVIEYPDGAPFKRAEFYKDGTAKVWPTHPLKWISLTIKLENVKE